MESGGCDRGIRSDVASDSDVGGGRSSLLASPLLPWPLSRCSHHHPLTGACSGARRSHAMRFLEFFRRGGRCGITTVPVVVVGAHGCRGAAALVHASRVASCPGACDWALSSPTLDAHCCRRWRRYGVGRAPLVARVLRRLALWRAARAFDLATRTLDDHGWRGRMLGSPRPFGGRLLTRRSSSPRKICPSLLD